MAVEKSIWKDKENTAVVDDSKESARIIEHDRVRIDRFIQQNSPVNNEMIRNSEMNDLYSAYISGKLQMLPTIVREKHGKAEQVINCFIFF